MSSTPSSPEVSGDTRRIVLVPHDPSWAEEFQRESPVVSPAFGDLLLSIHHIGSTAIPGIEAKPVIDMLAVVTSVERLDERTPEFESLGYEVMGEFGMPGRRYFRKNSPVGERTHQIHAFQAGSADVDRHLAFRDYLRADHKFARQYATLKSRLAEQYPSDMAAYTEGKNGFIRNVEARAATWRGQIR